MSALSQECNVPLARACAALGYSRATVYRRSKPRPTQPPVVQRHRSRRKLTDQQQAEILAVLHSDEFADQPPREVFGTLLSRGIYVCSVRTMYRVLSATAESKERRNQRAPQQWPAPSLQATAPNQVWTWDVTKLRGHMKGVFYCAFVVLDLYSRYVVAWMVATTENGELAELLFSEACVRYHIVPDSLIAHSDRGSPMKSDTLKGLFDVLGVSASFGRPRVSNDNAFSESQFRTLKYQPDYPDRFASLEHARAWLQEFITWYNEIHCHVGLALFTPADVFHGRVAAVAGVRQEALDAAYSAHPERFVRGRPMVSMPASVVRIDPDDLHRSRTFRCPEPPPEASVRPSPTEVVRDGAQGGSRAAQPPSECSGTLDAP